MRCGDLEFFRIACEYRDACPEFQPLVGPGKALQQPASEKPRSASDEDSLSTKFFPQFACAFQDVRKIGSERAIHHCLTGREAALCFASSFGAPCSTWIK